MNKIHYRREFVQPDSGSTLKTTRLSALHITQMIRRNTRVMITDHCSTKQVQYRT